MHVFSFRPVKQMHHVFTYFQLVQTFFREIRKIKWDSPQKTTAWLPVLCDSSLFCPCFELMRNISHLSSSFYVPNSSSLEPEAGPISICSLPLKPESFAFSFLALCLRESLTEKPFAAMSRRYQMHFAFTFWRPAAPVPLLTLRLPQVMPAVHCIFHILPWPQCFPPSTH